MPAWKTRPKKNMKVTTNSYVVMYKIYLYSFCFTKILFCSKAHQEENLCSSNKTDLAQCLHLVLLT